MSDPYEDILLLPHPVSKKHAPMPAGDRAAQFAPFAALTGYDAAVQETARLTQERLELDESERAALDDELAQLAKRLPEQPQIAVTYFLPDERKQGGAYVTATGALKKIIEHEHVLVLASGERIPMEEIIAIAAEHSLG